MMKSQRLRRFGGCRRFAKCGKHHMEAHNRRENLTKNKKKTIVVQKVAQKRVPPKQKMIPYSR
ncbi:MAG: hypothetical protein II381_07850, partial [Victivallales bacterium]|nr:hypothetical protein [Victivallales bacterium]